MHSINRGSILDVVDHLASGDEIQHRRYVGETESVNWSPVAKLALGTALPRPLHCAGLMSMP